MAFHRFLFRQRQRPWIISAANASAVAGLFCFAALCAGVIYFVVDIVLGFRSALIAAICVGTFFLLLWAAVPGVVRLRHHDDNHAPLNPDIERNHS